MLRAIAPILTVTALVALLPPVLVAQEPQPEPFAAGFAGHHELIGMTQHAIVRETGFYRRFYFSGNQQWLYKNS